MTHKEIQQQIDKAQFIKKSIEQWIEEKELPVGKRRKIETIEKEIMKACVKYDEIYQRLTRDAKRNKWSINDFEVNDYFDYETFDYDVSYL